MKNGISVSDSLQRLRNDTDGTAFLEFTMFVGVFFTLLFGIIEFSLAYSQWNAATKAVQLGARLAAVSDPVATGLESLTGMEGSAEPGDVMPSFSAVCYSDSITGATGSCTCSGFSCSYDVNSAAAIRRIAFGRSDRTACSETAPIGMCNIFRSVTPANVVVEYQYTGLGYAGRPAAEYATGQFASHAVPTISVSIGDPADPIPFQFFFLAGLMGFNDIEIPGLLSTVTGEDLSGQ